MSAETISLFERSILQHAIGANPYTKRELWGYRNRYVANPEDRPTWDALVVLEGLGLVTRRPKDERHFGSLKARSEG